MSDETRKLWKTQAGASLLKAMLRKEEITPEHRATIEQFKAIKTSSPQPAEKTEIPPND